MRALNRSAIVVRPKPPFLDWLHGVDPTSKALTLINLTREPTVHLVDECFRSWSDWQFQSTLLNRADQPLIEEEI
jgi:hypothetical protein